ncbi:MAG: glycosyltransferase family 39 protein [Vicinamibacteraceae bacterium]|nr:glycosyltransferase family 39 protein [Vicinamibacteraceae bacterium]
MSLVLHDETWPGCRRAVLLASVACAAMAFVGTGGNQFTPLGVLAWLTSIVLAALAFWPRQVPGRHDAGPVPADRASPGVRVALAFAVLVAAGFRLAALESSPPEMTSDHVEKLLDMGRVLAGARPVFFEGNGGREPLHFYLAALVVGSGLTGFELKALQVPTALAGVLTVPLVYLLGVEFTARRRVGVLAALLFASGWWPVVSSRVGLRFAFAPLFASLATWLVVRGLQRGRHDLLVLGALALGAGFYGYTAFRIVPVVIVVAVGLHAWSRSTRGAWRLALQRLLMIGAIVAVVVVPLARVAVDDPGNFWKRTATRMLTAERPYEEAVPSLIAKSAWRSAGMFWRNGGSGWIMGPPGEPALDLVVRVLFAAGLVAVARRVWTRGGWVDWLLLAAVPLLVVPSALALAFPVEVPSLNRSACAQTVVFIVAAIGLDALWRRAPGRARPGVQCAVVGVVLAVSAASNARVVFDRYPAVYRTAAPNAGEVAREVRAFAESEGRWDAVWIWARAHWLDARAVGIHAGQPGWANVVADWADAERRLAEASPGPVLFVVHPRDRDVLARLRAAYPDGVATRIASAVSPSKDFVTFRR